MANRRQLVKRRKTVSNIRKITRTMQLIATARFQKAMKQATATKPYAQRLSGMLDAVSGQAADQQHPLLSVNQGDSSAIIVISSNRGLCGAYNGSVLRTCQAEIRRQREAGQTVALHAVGKKGINYFKFLGQELASARTDIDDQPRYEQVAALAQSMMGAYANGEVASVHVCYMQFVSASTQRPEVMQLLPFAVSDAADGDDASQRDAGQPPAGAQRQYDYSPPAGELLMELLPATVRMRLFQCFTDAAVSEQMARMVAMKAATDAASDMITILTRQYNRARQTQITMELLDIIGGAAAVS